MVLAAVVVPIIVSLSETAFAIFPAMLAAFAMTALLNRRLWVIDLARSLVGGLVGLGTIYAVLATWGQVAGDDPPSSSRARVCRVETGILVEGRIDRVSSELFERLLGTWDGGVPPRVFLNSPGGRIGSAIDMGRIVADTGLETVITEQSQCTSSCTILFASGRWRTADPMAKFGFHAAFNRFGLPFVRPIDVVSKDERLSKPLDRFPALQRELMKRQAFESTTIVPYDAHEIADFDPLFTRVERTRAVGSCKS